MDFKQLNQINELINDIQILPGINTLVNVLYTDKLNKFLNKNQTSDDRRILLMFLIMYFYSYLSIPKEVKENTDIKQNLKIFLSDLIADHTKRSRCLEMYRSFETTVSLMGFKFINKKIEEIE